MVHFGSLSSRGLFSSLFFSPRPIHPAEFHLVSLYRWRCRCIWLIYKYARMWGVREWPVSPRGRTPLHGPSPILYFFSRAQSLPECLQPPSFCPPFHPSLLSIHLPHPPHPLHRLPKYFSEFSRKARRGYHRVHPAVPLHCYFHCRCCSSYTLHILSATFFYTYPRTFRVLRRPPGSAFTPPPRPAPANPNSHLPARTHQTYTCTGPRYNTPSFRNRHVYYPVSDCTNETYGPELPTSLHPLSLHPNREITQRRRIARFVLVAARKGLCALDSLPSFLSPPLELACVSSSHLQVTEKMKWMN